MIGVAVRLERLFLDDDPAVGERPLAGQYFYQFGLAVAGHAGDADDLAGIDLEREFVERGQAFVVLRHQSGEFEHGIAGRHRLASRALADDGVADHHLGHVGGRQVRHLAAADHAAAAQHGDAVAEGRDLAELVRDHDDRDFLALRHAAQQAEHFVGFAGGQHRGRLIEDHQALVEIQKLEDFELLLFAGGERRHGHVKRHAERHAVEEGVECRNFLLPVDHGRRVGAADHQVFGAGQRRHQREVLVDHADATGARVARIANVDFVAIEHHGAARCLVVAHDAFDERRLASAVLAEQRVEGAGLDFH